MPVFFGIQLLVLPYDLDHFSHSKIIFWSDFLLVFLSAALFLFVRLTRIESRGAYSLTLLGICIMTSYALRSNIYPNNIGAAIAFCLGFFGYAFLTFSRKTQLTFQSLFYSIYIVCFFFYHDLSNVPHASIGKMYNVFAAYIFAMFATYHWSGLRMKTYFVNAQLKFERNRSILLLHQILPSSIVDEFQNKGEIEPKRHEQVTILFTDFINFTQLSSNYPPRLVLKSLDYYFGVYDKIVRKYRIQKLKTIGDSYMAAAGVPFAINNHSTATVLAALEILEIHKIKPPADLLNFQVRIGIHSGPVASGIVGESQIHYDVWGDTVNLASRAEKLSEEGKINITLATKENLHPEEFHYESRGCIEVKGRGQVEMFFVSPIKGSKL